MTISRRGLLIAGVAVGGGLAVWYGNRRLDDGNASLKFGASTPDLNTLNAWVKIDTDGKIICGVHRAEMGQGVSTALPMMLAEELDADWTQVAFEFTPVDRDYFNFGIMENGRPFGPIADDRMAAAGTALLRRVFHAMGMAVTISSTSIVDAWDTLRPAGAAAREMLVAAAARRWQIPREQLQTENGRVLNPLTGDSLGYGELAAAAATERPPRDAIPKDPADWRLCGRSPPRLDGPDKSTGRATFAADQRFPGMRFATVVQSPVAGGRIEAFDDSRARKVTGVERILQVDDKAIIVIADSSWTALQAAGAIDIETTPGSGAGSLNSTELLEEYRSLLDAPDASVFRDDGDITAALKSSDQLESDYQLAFVAHACMEPMSCTALLENGRATVWAPTQSNSVTRDVVAELLQFEPRQITIHRSLMGGAFGRRAEMDFVEYAVHAAKAMPGTVVQLMYSREEDTQHDMYRPAAVVRVRGGLDESGRVKAFDFHAVTQSVTADYFRRTPTPRGGDAQRDGTMVTAARRMVYDIPHLRVTALPRDPGVPIGYWRSPGSSGNCFVVESFMDELAQAAKVDPLEFRLRHLQPLPRHRRVLEAVARESDWGRPPGPGRGRGIAMTDSCGSVCAQVVDVTLDGSALSIDRITCVIDCGPVIYPDGLHSQVEGSIVDGLAAALHGEITLADGRVQQSNFHDYRFLRLAETPPIDIVVLPAAGRPGGAGEPALPAVAPALVNAIADAGGPRVRELPIMPALQRPRTWIVGRSL
ncbi:MAG: molybdopterin-dependent oxidoreductase [Gammaproteobacteria bacterium]|nr:molybdopterin-dependent oxidoreductase [Gammaproteobacteria bacterium]